MSATLSHVCLEPTAAQRCFNSVTPAQVRDWSVDWWTEALAPVLGLVSHSRRPAIAATNGSKVFSPGLHAPGSEMRPARRCTAASD